MHSIFYISQLRKYVLGPNYIVVTKHIEVAEKSVYKGHPSSQGFWANYIWSELTWEAEDNTRNKHPYLEIYQTPPSNLQVSNMKLILKGGDYNNSDLIYINYFG